jgi:hypothetical protein
MHLAERAPQEHQPFLREVVAGLREIASRRWLSASLVSFALGNVALATYFVLGRSLPNGNWAVLAPGALR